MSNIPKSERKPTKKDFFDKAIDVREKVVKYKENNRFVIMGLEIALDIIKRNEKTA